MSVGKILRELCEWKEENENIKEAKVCLDHLYMLLGIPPKHNMSSFIRYLKAESSINYTI